jgi:hypothetical protein
VTSTPDLSRLAEQAVLGAALAGGYPATGSLSAGDFADPVHQAIHAAIATEPASRGAFTRLRDWLASLFSRQARSTRSYLDELPALCPDLGHGESYAAMVAEAAAERMAALQARQAALQAQRARPPAFPVRTPPRALGHSQNGQAIGQRDGPARGALRLAGDSRDKLAAAADYLATPDAGQRQKIAQATSKEASAVLSALDPEVARLARALRPAVRSMARQAAASAGPDMASAASTPGTMTTRDADSTWLQEQLLTALLQHPGEATLIVGKLPEAAFTAGPHREIWQMISQHVAEGKPFDPLILAWAASQRDDHRVDAAESLATMTLRLATNDATPGPAGTLARAVHADHLCTTRLGVEWANMPQQADATTGQAETAPGQQAEQAPAPARTPATSPAPSSPAPAATVRQPGRQQPAAAAGGQVPLLPPPEPSPTGPTPVQ